MGSTLLFMFGIGARAALRALCCVYFRVIYERIVDSYFIIILMTCTLKDETFFNWAPVSLTADISQTIQK